jgi:DNA-binding response OmpR family regulator
MDAFATRSILLLEDEPLVALDVELMVRQADLGQTVLLASCEEAEDWLESHSPNAAVLDIHLCDGDCSVVAQILVNRGIPFVVYSGEARSTRNYNDVFLKGEWVCKPSPPGALTDALRTCMAEMPLLES